MKREFPRACSALQGADKARRADFPDGAFEASSVKTVAHAGGRNLKWQGRRHRIPSVARVESAKLGSR